MGHCNLQSSILVSITANLIVLRMSGYVKHQKSTYLNQLLYLYPILFSRRPNWSNREMKRTGSVKRTSNHHKQAVSHNCLHEPTQTHSELHSEQNSSPGREIPICWVGPLTFASPSLHPMCLVMSPCYASLHGDKAEEQPVHLRLYLFLGILSSFLCVREN